MQPMPLTPQALSIGRYLLPISAKFDAAPAAAMRSGAVTEPEHTGLALAALHQAEVGCGKQRGSGFGDRRQKGVRAVQCPDSFHGERVRLIPKQAGMTLGALQKLVEQRRISSPACFPLLHKRADVFTQCSCMAQK